MKFLIITNAPTLKKDNSYYSYAPYVNEMNIWCNYVDEVGVLSPTSYNQKLLLASFVKDPKMFSIPSIAFTSLVLAIKSVFVLPFIFFKIYKAMLWADHIHLRCPGNIGLLGCLVQIAFPSKIKTAKYAGNWDPEAKQPYSYRIQKKILRSTFLTKNIQVLVYGNWACQTKNIKPFFTATYRESEIATVKNRNYKEALCFVFVGTLVDGKCPLYAIKIIEELSKKGYNVNLDIYGEGYLKERLKKYIENNNLQDFIFLHGNQDKSRIKNKLKQSHFLILPSKSEGWPKVIAEAMFFGVIPIATKVSCIPDMLDSSNRGILIDLEFKSDLEIIINYLQDQDKLKLMSKLAVKWSQHYTLDLFETEIKKLLKR